MSKKVIFAVLFSFSLLLVVVEFFVNPPKTHKVSSVNLENNDAILAGEDITQEEEPISAIYVNNKSFEDIGILDVNISNIALANILFKTAKLNTIKDGFRSISVVFKQGDNVILKVIEFQPSETSSSSRIFNIVKSRVYQSIPISKRDKITINQTNSFGEHSFYYNNKEEFPNMVFLVIKGKDKVLAFEYEQKRHDIVIKSINSLF